MSGFIKLNRCASTLELLQAPNEWALLSLIAYRGQWSKETISIHGLMPGQSFIGDCKACGLSQKQYVTAKKHLQEWGLATFKGTNKGTIATLSDTRIYDIFGNNKDKPKIPQGERVGTYGDKPAVTNENGTKERKLKPKDEGERGNDSPKIKINDYGDIMNPDNPPITVACTVTGDYWNSAGAGFFNKALKIIGDRCFREAVAELWGELKSDTIDNPGAILTNKLKKLMKHAEEAQTEGAKR